MGMEKNLLIHSSHKIKDDEVRNAVRKGQRVLNYSEQQIQ
jgi:hypothetical protein